MQLSFCLILLIYATFLFCREEHELLEAVEAKLVVHPLTAPILGNDHNEFRSRESSVSKFLSLLRVVIRVNAKERLSFTF